MQYLSDCSGCVFLSEFDGTDLACQRPWTLKNVDFSVRVVKGRGVKIHLASWLPHSLRSFALSL